MNVLNVCKSFQKQEVIHQLSFSVEPRLSHGLLGANGAGKSTFIKMLMGLVFPDSGQIETPDSITLLPENPYLPLNLTGFQVVHYACSVQGIAQTEVLLKEVRLKQEAWHKPIRTYSKGMKQRVSIAASLSGQPEWLILDEPMSGLDAMGRAHMLDLFANRNSQGISVLMCSHAVTDLVRLCNVVHIMAKGQMTESIRIKEHSMQEVEHLENRLKFWSSEHAMD